MAYDPNLPANHSQVISQELRYQFNGLADLINLCASGIPGIAPVVFDPGDDMDTKVQKLADKLNELIAGLGGQLPPPPAASVSIHDTPARLEMSAPGNNPVFWVIESSTDEINWTDLATIDGAETTWAISDTSLYYRVRGVDAAGHVVVGESNSVLMSRDG